MPAPRLAARSYFDAYPNRQTQSANPTLASTPSSSSVTASASLVRAVSKTSMRATEEVPQKAPLVTATPPSAPALRHRRMSSHSNLRGVTPGKDVDWDKAIEMEGSPGENRASSASSLFLGKASTSLLTEDLQANSSSPSNQRTAVPGFSSIISASYQTIDGTICFPPISPPSPSPSAMLVPPTVIAELPAQALRHNQAISPNGTLRKSASFASNVFQTPVRPHPVSEFSGHSGRESSPARPASPPLNYRPRSRSSDRPLSNSSPAFPSGSPSLHQSASNSSLAVPSSTSHRLPSLSDSSLHGIFTSLTHSEHDFDCDTGSYVAANRPKPTSVSEMDEMVAFVDHLSRARPKRSREPLLQSIEKRHATLTESSPLMGVIPQGGRQGQRTRDLTASSTSSGVSNTSSFSFASMTAGPPLGQLKAPALPPDALFHQTAGDAQFLDDAILAARLVQDDGFSRLRSGASLDSITRAYKGECPPTPLTSSSLNLNFSASANSLPHLPSPLPASPSPNSSTPHPRHDLLPTPNSKIKSIDDIIREHTGNGLTASRGAAVPPGTPAQLLASTALERNSKSNLSVSDDPFRSSIDSVDEEIRVSLHRVDANLTPRTPELKGFSPSPRGSYSKSEGDASSFKSSYSRSTLPTRKGTPAPCVDSDALAVEWEVATLLRSPRLTRLLTLNGAPNRGITVSFADVGCATGHPVVVFLGLGAVRYLIALYDEMAEAFGLRLICIDRWGLGRTSDVSDDQRGFIEWSGVVGEVMDELGLLEYSLLAHSAGSPYAFAASLKSPQRIRGSIHLLAPWVSTSADSLAGAFKYLKYVPSGVIKTAQAAEWRMRAWRLGKPPTIVHEAVGYDHRAGVRSSDVKGKGDVSIWDNSDSVSLSPTSLYPAGRVMVNGRPLKQKSGRRAFFSGVFGNGIGGGQASKPPEVAPTSSGRSLMTPPSTMRGSPVLERRASTISTKTSPEPTESSEDWILSSPPTHSPTSTPPPVGPPSLSGAELAKGLMRASHAESLRGSKADLMVILDRTARPWGFRYSDIGTPVKIWHGDKDDRVSLTSVQSLQRELVACKIEVVEGADHSLMTNGPVMVQVLESIAEEWQR